MGSIYQRGNVWWIKFTCQGERIRESVGSSKSLAERALAKRETEVFEGKFFPKKKRTCVSVAEMVRKFLELHAPKLRGMAHKPVLRRIDEEFGHFPLDRITVPMVIRFMNRLKEESSVSNANRHHTVFRSLFNRAIDWGMFSGDNPLAKVKQEREDNARLRFLTHDEIKRLVEACSLRLRPVVLCALWTGMRRGELLRMDWEHIDLNTNTIYILESKSGKPRELPIAAKLREVLVQLGPQPGGSVFKMPAVTLKRHFEDARKKAKIENFRFHDIRHTFASYFVMNTGDLPTLQKLLGHHSSAMTQRYAHLSSDHLRSGIQKLEQGLGTIWAQSESSEQHGS